jgi:hypothetical protein
VFGLTFWESAVVVVVGLVLLGPKELPRYLRKAGRLAGRASGWIKDLERDHVLLASAFALLAAMAVCLIGLTPHLR